MYVYMKKRFQKKRYGPKNQKLQLCSYLMSCQNYDIFLQITYFFIQFLIFRCAIHVLLCFQKSTQVVQKILFLLPW